MLSLYDLPDEIILEIVRSLEAIRSHKTQSVAFTHKRIEKERQRENHIRQRTLYALCLASHRLRCIALPTLYTSSITCATWDGLRRLQLFYRTISNFNNALGQTKRLAEHIRYVENRLADYLGNSLQDDEVFQQQSASTYFQLLAKIVLCAPNVENLCVVSLEHEDITLWSHLLSKSHCSINHGSAKLACLSCQIHTYPQSSMPGFSVFERISQTLGSFSMLSELRVSGATIDQNRRLALRLGDIPSIRRLDLTECNLETLDLANMLQACRNLRHFTCRWSFMNGPCGRLSQLHGALLAHADTLETLILDPREVSYGPYHVPGPNALGSLRCFRSLKFLEISELGFLSSDVSLLDYPDQALESRISVSLPESLEQLTLLVEIRLINYCENALESASCLWELAHDRKAMLSNMKMLCMVSRHKITAPDLVAAFKDSKVQLKVENDS